MAVEHLSDMLQHSVLRSADVDAERQVILEEINPHEDDPGDLVHDLFTETLWPGHPLGRPILGTRESIEGASRDQVRRFYRRHYRPANMVVAIELIQKVIDPMCEREFGRIVNITSGSVKMPYWFCPASQEPTRAGIATLLLSLTSFCGSMPFIRSASSRNCLCPGNTGRWVDSQSLIRCEDSESSADRACVRRRPSAWCRVPTR